MKAAVISFLFCIGYLNVQCQAVQTWTRQQTIALMKAYGGSATSCHVTATNKDYDTCVVCTANEINVFAGTGSGSGRKWKQQSDSLKLDKNNFTDSLNNHPMFFSNANGSIGDSITWLKNDSTLIFRRIAVGSTGSSNDSVLFLQVPPIAVPTGHATINPSIGTLSTVIASDANIPIDQTMAPTWTGLHTFQNILSAASGSEYGLIISPSVNQTSTAGYTALLINPTQVTTGSGGKVLISTQVGGVEQFGVDNVGEIYTVSGIENESSNTYAKIAMPTTGMILSRSRADAVSAVTISNLNASSTGDILTLKNSGGTVVNVTKAGVLSATSPILTTPVINVGSDATGDIYYRNSGILTRLPIGSTGKKLTVVGGVPAWVDSTASGTSNIAGGTLGAIPYQSGANTTTVLAATATASKMLLSGASAAPTWSTSTIPTSAGATANKVLLSDGTNYVLSTPTFPNASATSRKIIVSDGTNWTASTELWPVATTNGNIMQANGTDWVSTATPALGAITATSINGNILTTGSSTYTGTAAQTYTFPTTSATIARTDAANTFTGHQTIEGVTSTGATGTANFVFSASPTLSGTATIPALRTLTNAVLANFYASGSDGILTAQSTATLLFGGASTVSFRNIMNGQTATVLGVADSYGGFIVGSQAATEAASGVHAMMSNVVINPLTITNGTATTTDAATLYVNGAMTGVTPTGRNDALKVNGTSAFTGNMTFTGTNAGVFITTGSNARAGDATLVAGTLAITITGLTTSSRAQVTRTVAAGTTLTTGITAVCTANTLTITADLSGGTINTADTSTYTYFIVN